MFGLGTGELLVLLVIGLLLFGKQLPNLARSLGKGFAELRQETRQLSDDVNNSLR